MQSPFPGTNPELPEVEDVEEPVDELVDELLLVAVVLPELDELVPPPPDPPPPSMFTLPEHPACISMPSETSKTLAKTSSDERRGVVSVRFMMESSKPTRSIHHANRKCRFVRRIARNVCATLCRDGYPLSLARFGPKCSSPRKKAWSVDSGVSGCAAHQPKKPRNVVSG
jgi:hypothetical protein